MFICIGVWAFFLSFNQKIRVSKNWPTSTEKNWRRKFVEKMFFQFIFGLRAEKFEQLNKKFTQDCQNYVQRLQRDNFGTLPWNEEKVLKLFAPCSAELFDFWREKFGRFVKKSAYVSSGTFKGFLEGSVIVRAFSVSEPKYPAVGKNFLDGLPKRLFTCPQQNFEKKWQM